MMYDPRIETMSRDELMHLQLERLQIIVNRAVDNVSFYRRRFRDLGLDAGDVRTLEDLTRLPFTTKNDLVAQSPYGLLAVPLRDIVRFQTSSGLLGRTCIVGYTKRDLTFWRDLMARIMAAAGVTAQDIVQLTFSYGLETGGIAFEFGAETLGASVVPAGQAARSVQVGVMRDFRSTVLGATPSYAWRLMEYMEEIDVDPKRLDLRLGLFGAEPWSEEVRRQLAERLFIQCFDVYGLAELIGPGVAGECEALAGLHLAEDHFLPEIIDPETGNVLPPGEEGELVLTTLRREAQPLIRYRTGDLTRLDPVSCSCGRTHARISRISKRTDDIIIFGGVSVLPREVGTVLAGFPIVGAEYEIEVSRKVMSGELHIRVEVDEEAIRSDEAVRQNIALKIKNELKLVTGADFTVTLHPMGTLAKATDRNGHVVWDE